MQEESEREDNKKEHLTLKQILEKMKGTQTEWKYETKRPFHLGECLREYNSSILKRKISIEDLNVFSSNRKSIKINGDRKRIWDSQFKNGKDCLKRNIQSMPINIK
jgi:hemerythrin-like domain-containing protein